MILKFFKIVSLKFSVQISVSHLLLTEVSDTPQPTPCSLPDKVFIILGGI